MLDLERICEAAKASLIAGMPAAVADVNTITANDPLLGADPVIVAPTDDAYHIGGADRLWTPWVELAVANFEYLNLNIAQRGDATPRLLVRVQVNDVTPVLVYKQLLRYTHALTAVLLDLQAFAGIVRVSPEEGLRGAFRGWDIETAKGSEDLFGTGLVAMSLSTGQ